MQVQVTAGRRFKKALPYSGACVHLGVAGREMEMEMLRGGRAVQLYGADGRAFSAPITAGEAGILYEYDDAGEPFYFYWAQ